MLANFRTAGAELALIKATRYPACAGGGTAAFGADCLAALFEHADLAAGQAVLIHGGAGGVGTLAVQLARWRGARVVATASARELALVRSLGADEVID